MKHETLYRVSYGDTDCMNVVYYANYLEFFERSRTEMLRSAGLPYREMEKNGFFLPVGEADLKYFRPAHYDDLLSIRSEVLEMGGASLTVGSEVWRDGELLVKGSVKLICVNAERKVMRLPEMLKEKCRMFLTEKENGK